MTVPDLSSLGDAWKCSHPDVVLTKKRTERKGWWYWEQCTTCGAKIRRRASAEVPRAWELPDFDEELATRWWQDRSAQNEQRRQAEADAENQRWWAWYSDYLRSPRWHAIRSKVLRRAAGMCEGCAEQPATQVHHLTYAHVGNEMLFDLVAICNDCHERVTEADRAAHQERP